MRLGRPGAGLEEDVMRLSLLAVLPGGLLLLGCPARSGGGGASPSAPPTAVGDPASAEAGPAGAQGAEPRPAATPAGLEGIGFDAVPPRPSRSAVEANRRALHAHKGGRYDESRRGFAEAVRLEPTYDIARYNLACALARDGEVDAARREIEPLLSRDLPSFGSRLSEDPDLESLRAAPSGVALLEAAARRRPAWELALGQGVPAVMWREGQNDVGMPVTELLRVGVYVHATRRFVPMSGAVPRAFAGLVFPAERRALVVTGQGFFSGIPQISGLGLHLVEVPTFEQVASFRAPPVASVGRAEAHLVAGGIRFRTEFEPEAYRRWHVVGPGGSLARDADQEPPRVPWLDVAPEGAILSIPAPPGYEVRGNSLVVPAPGEPIALGPGHGASRHHSVLVSADRRVAIALSVRADCPEGEGVLRHFVDRVDLTTRVTTRLSEGDGSAAARLGPEGALYLQIGTSLRRYSTPAAESSDSLPPGMLLTAPMYMPDCSA